MARNFVIGIGGTGARCVESFLQICAAGLGPDNVSVGLIDQDQGNGNVTRARTLARSLFDLRAQLRQDGGHRLAAKAPFLRTEIDLIGESGFWCPLQGDNPSIREAFGYPTMNESLRHLFEGLFSYKEQIQGLDLGYRGRPHLGAAIMAGRAFTDDPFWKALADGLEQGAGGAGGARLFVFGSLFGGTGAAGFPTLARIVRGLPSLQGITNIHLGGSLMLPYFQYAEPEDDDQSVRARASEFVKSAENALRYYNRLFEIGTIYNEVYVVGWNPLISVPHAKNGGPPQANPPMIPELYAALAASRFLQSPNIAATPQFYKIGIRDEGAVAWSDLPAVTEGVGESPDSARQRVQKALARQLRFSFAFRRVFRPALLEKTWRRYRREEWMQRQIIAASIKDPGDSAVSAILDRLDDFAEAHLRWAAAISAVGAGGSSRPLYDFQHYARIERQREGGPFSIKLHDEETTDGDRIAVSERPRFLPDDQRAGFGRLLVGSEDSGLGAIMKYLTYEVPDPDHQKLGRFVGELHEACA